MKKADTKEVKKRIGLLVVASEPEEIGNIIRAFDEDDYDFITAKSVPEALSNITYRLPSVIVSEVELPDVDGFAFLEKIRKGIKTRLISRSCSSQNPGGLKNGCTPFRRVPTRFL